MKENLLLVSLILFLIALVFYIFDYFFYHHFGKDLKFHKERKDTPEKPFITNLIGIFATMLFASSVVILLLGLIVY